MHAALLNCSVKIDSPYHAFNYEATSLWKHAFRFSGCGLQTVIPWGVRVSIQTVTDAGNSQFKTAFRWWSGAQEWLLPLLFSELVQYRLKVPLYVQNRAKSLFWSFWGLRIFGSNIHTHTHSWKTFFWFWPEPYEMVTFTAIVSLGLSACIKELGHCRYRQSSGAVWKSRWPSWAFRPNEPYGFYGRKAILNHA